MLSERIRNLHRTLAFRLTLWYAAFFSGGVLIAFTGFHFLLLRGIHHVELSPYSLHELLEAYRGFFAYALGGVILLSLSAGWFLAWRALLGVQEVRRTAQSIARGEFNSRVPIKGTGDEIDQLAVTFNGMLAQIETVLSGMKEVNDNIAHDLRSPITRMRGMAEVTLAGQPEAQDYQMALARVIEECDRLLGIINTMLDISEAEAGIARLKMTKLDLSEMVRDVTDLFSPVAEGKHINLTARATDPLLICADARKLQRILSNLMDNAIKYTPDGGSVTISSSATDEEACIVVEDTGLGIADTDLDHIFDRFYRAEKSRSEPGSGLGLSLARAFVMAHGGTIKVKSSIEKGSQFIVTLPGNICSAESPRNVAEKHENAW